MIDDLNLKELENTLDNMFEEPDYLSPTKEKILEFISIIRPISYGEYEIFMSNFSFQYLLFNKHNMVESFDFDTFVKCYKSLDANIYYKLIIIQTYFFAGNPKEYKSLCFNGIRSHISKYYTFSNYFNSVLLYGKLTLKLVDEYLEFLEKDLPLSKIGSNLKDAIYSFITFENRLSDNSILNSKLVRIEEFVSQLDPDDQVRLRLENEVKVFYKNNSLSTIVDEEVDLKHIKLKNRNELNALLASDKVSNNFKNKYQIMKLLYGEDMEYQNNIEYLDSLYVCGKPFVINKLLDFASIFDLIIQSSQEQRGTHIGTFINAGCKALISIVDNYKEVDRLVFKEFFKEILYLPFFIEKFKDSFVLSYTSDFINQKIDKLYELYKIKSDDSFEIFNDAYMYNVDFSDAALHGEFLIKESKKVPVRFIAIKFDNEVYLPFYKEKKVKQVKHLVLKCLYERNDSLRKTKNNIGTKINFQGIEFIDQNSFVITSTDGEEYVINNLNTYCKEYSQIPFENIDKEIDKLQKHLEESLLNG